MKAMQMQRVTSLLEDYKPLTLVSLPDPVPAKGEVRLRVTACGVCHTELDEIEGRTPPPHLPVVPGHEVVGRVDVVGEDVTAWKVGDRVGVGWIHSSCGGVRENLSPEFRATGRDVDGGYAEYMTVPERYAFAIPSTFTDAQAAPLLCAGGVGYRALTLTGIKGGDSLGLTGFGASAHLILQLARHLYPDNPICVFARDPEARTFAMELGATWAGNTDDRPPEPLHAIIDTTPAWKPVVEGLASLRPGGRLVINAIRKEDTDKSELLRLSYAQHLWLEREIKSVANVNREDIATFLLLAAECGIRPEVHTRPLEQANDALVALKYGRVQGANVLLMG
ncbi:MAG: alcohol dehydrogenase catalytic domain-containing protein [Gammaproteobacteria bacterium]